MEKINLLRRNNLMEIPKIVPFSMHSMKYDIQKALQKKTVMGN